MKVKELIDLLTAQNPEAEVRVYDEGLFTTPYLSRSVDEDQATDEDRLDLYTMTTYDGICPTGTVVIM